MDDSHWLPALRALAEATGANHGEMIGLGSAAGIPFNGVSDMPPEALEEFAAVGGGDPRVNPRVKAGLEAAELQVLAEADFAAPEDLAATPIYADLFTRYDTPFCTLTRLSTSHDVTIGVATLRSARQGHAEEADRERFRTIAEHARSAVNMRLGLQHRGAELVSGALEAVAAAAFVIDGMGNVAAMTPAAEALVSGREPRLRLVDQRLAGRTPQDDAVIGAFMSRVMARLELAGPPPMVTLRGGGDPVVLEAMRAPGVQHGFGFGLHAVVVARAGVAPERSHAAMQAAFGLTPAEVAVALLLIRGMSPDDVAADRGVSIETVRSQIRGLMNKTDSRRQSELVARLIRYL